MPWQRGFDVYSDSACLSVLTFKGHMETIWDPGKILSRSEGRGLQDRWHMEAKLCRWSVLQWRGQGRYRRLSRRVRTVFTQNLGPCFSLASSRGTLASRVLGVSTAILFGS